MDYFVYLLFRAFTALILALPLIVVYRLGQALGFMGWLRSYCALPAAGEG